MVNSSAAGTLEAAPGSPHPETLTTASEEFMATKQRLDRRLEEDYTFIIGKLDESYYSDDDEGQVIDVFRRWGEERFATRPGQYPRGGEYLDKLFSKLKRKTKDVGIITTQITSYYSMIFNHFDRVDEVEAIRDTYSRLHRRDSGIEEISFGSEFWTDVKEGRIRDQIYAYGRGVTEGLWSGAKGTADFAVTVLTNPGKALNDLKNLPGAVKSLWEARGELVDRFVAASPEEQAEMIGRFVGEVEFALGSSAAGGAAMKGLSKAAETSGNLGRVARATRMIVEAPSTAVRTVAKHLKTIVLRGGRIAAEGAVFAARGVMKVAGRVLRGTWSVAEKAAGKIKIKLYYFYDDAAGVMKNVEERVARIYCRCSKCALTAEGMLPEQAADDVRMLTEQAIQDGLSVHEEYMMHTLLGVEKHHPVFQMFTRAFKKAGISKAVHASGRLKSQRLVTLSRNLHQEFLHEVWDRIAPAALRRQRGASNAIAKLIKKGKITPEDILDRLEAFYLRERDNVARLNPEYIDKAGRVVPGTDLEAMDEILTSLSKYRAKTGL